MAACEVPVTMKALIKRECTESYFYEDVPTPEPVGDEVLIKVKSVAICGSDISLYKWNEVAKVIATLPFIPGHEAAGVVVKTGPRATLKVGDRICVENHFFCDTCYQCLHDGRGICSNMGQYGTGKGTKQGGCSEYSAVSSKFCYKLQTNISFEEGTLLEPLGVAHNAIENLDVKNEAVLILGAGAVGILACQVAKALGATTVLIVDIADERLELARRLGADVTVNVNKQDLAKVKLCARDRDRNRALDGFSIAVLHNCQPKVIAIHQLVNIDPTASRFDDICVVNDITNGDGIGRICEVTGAEPMIECMFALLRKGGHIVMVGIPKKPIHIEKVLPNFLFKSLTLKTIHGRRIYKSWEESERLVADGRVNAPAIVTHRAAMSDYEDAFEALFSGEAIKIVMDPSK